MRFKQTILFLAFLVVVYSCGNSSSDKNSKFKERPVIEKYDTSNVSNSRAQANVSTAEEIVDSSAVGNIKFGVDRSTFIEQRKIFNSQITSLGGLDLASIEGFFYEGKLFAVEIISKRNNGIKHTPWATIVKTDSKYKKIYLTEQSLTNKHLRYKIPEEVEKINSFEEAKYEFPYFFYTDNKEVYILENYQVSEMLENVSKKIKEQYQSEIRKIESAVQAQRTGSVTDISISSIAFSECKKISRDYFIRYKDQAEKIVEARNEAMKRRPQFSIIRILFLPTYKTIIQNNRRTKEEANIRNSQIQKENFQREKELFQ